MFPSKRELDVYALDSLIRLLKRCVVRIFAGEAKGSGFFIAPNLVLTCSHVIPNANDAITIHWDKHDDIKGILRKKLSDHEPDLALVEVALPNNVQHPCVLVRGEVLLNDPLYTFGHPEGEYATGGDPVTFNSEDFARNKDGLDVLKMKAGQSVPGLSGSPVLNQRTGFVCGVVMTTRDQFSDLGGRAVPIDYAFEAFRGLHEQNEMYHRQDRGWISLVSQRTGAKAVRFASNQDEPRADWLIICPIKEQWDSLLLKLPNATQGEDSGIEYATSLVDFSRPGGSSGSYRVVVARASQTHNTMAVLTTGAIQRFRPYCLMIAGTAAGVKKNVKLGDLVLADAVVDHQVRMIASRRIEIQPKFISTDADLVLAARNVNLDALDVKLPRPAAGGGALRVGIAASLDVPVDRAQYVRSLLKTYADLVGVHTQSSGVAVAGSQSAYEPRLMAVYGIADYTDSGKGAVSTSWVNYACEMTAAFVVTFLQSGALIQPFVPDMRVPPGVRTAATGSSGQISPFQSAPAERAGSPARAAAAQATTLVSTAPPAQMPEQQELAKRKSVLFADNWKKLGVKVKELSVTKTLNEDGSSVIDYRIEGLELRNGEISGLRFVLRSVVGYISRPKNDSDAEHLNIGWDDDEKDRLKPLPITQKLNALRVLSGVLTFKLTSNDPPISFGWSVTVLNGDAMSDWEYNNMYHRDGQRHVDDSPLNGPREFFARLAWLPAETLSVRVKLPERIVDRPFLKVFGYSAIEAVPTSEFIQQNVIQTYPTVGSDWALPKKWRVDYAQELAEAPRLIEPESKVAAVTIDRPLIGTYYSLDWKLPKPELDPKFLHLISIAGNLRKKLLDHRKRRLKNLSDERTLLIRELFAGFDREMRTDFSPEEDERIAISLLTYDDETHKLVPVEALINGEEPPPNAWDFWLPFGLGLAGAAFRECQAFMYVREADDTTPTYYIPVENSSDHEFLIALPLDHPLFPKQYEHSPERCRQIPGVVTIGSNFDATNLKQLLYEPKVAEALRDGCQKLCNEICEALNPKSKPIHTPAAPLQC